MRKRIFVMLMALTLSIPCTSYAEETDTANQLQSAALVDILYNQDEGNVVISDMSINMALSMLLEGANGETKSQLEEYLEDDAETIRTNNEKVLSGLSDCKNATLEIANSLWYDDDMVIAGQEIYPDYITVLEDSYYAAINEADFSDPDTADLINNWCSENTNGLIEEIVSADTIADQSAILANALYFLGTWTDPFPNATEGIFHGVDGDETAEMMLTQVDDYCENDFATAFIKYYYDDYAFVGILPKDEDNFNLADMDILGLIETRTDEYTVNIEIPKFTVEYTATLSDALKDTGLTNLFSSDADLFGIADFLYISEIFHKTYISVDEVGTEAAAVTSVMMDMAAEFEAKETKEVYLDRPFAFVIMNGSDNILFIGKIVTI